MLLSTNKGRWTTYSINMGYRKGAKVATSEAEKLQPSNQKVATSIKNKEELAILLGKSENYLKDKFIYRMQKEGKIEALYPLTPNHPEQAYKTTETYSQLIN